MTHNSQDSWAVAQGEREGLPIIYRYRPQIDLNINHAEYSTMVVISWLFDGSENNGFPDPNINKQQNLLEELLAHLDNPNDSFLTQIVTHNGSKEWLWYVKNCDDWMSKLNLSLSGQSAFPITIHFYDEPEWATYKGFIDWVSQ